MIRAPALVALGMLILACGIDPAISRELPVHGKRSNTHTRASCVQHFSVYGGRHRIGVHAKERNRTKHWSVMTLYGSADA